MKNNSLIKRKKITVVNNYSVHPAIFGGQIRVAELYLNLSRWYDIEIVSLSDNLEKSIVEITDGFKEIQIPRSKEQINYEIDNNDSSLKDILFFQSCKYNKEFIDAIVESIIDSNIIISSQPYSINAILMAIGENDIPIIYDSQNVEFELKGKIISNNTAIEELYKYEKLCCDKAKLILSCSEEDKNKFIDLYNIDDSKIIIVPNGMKIFSNAVLDKSSKNGEKNTSVFIGSYFDPNLKAVEKIVEIAKEFKEDKFLIVGNCGNYLNDKDIPMNVKVLGMVAEEEKRKALLEADVALNPIPYGSGTNLKILEYFGYKKPVITTFIGGRGLDLQNGKHALICEFDDFREKYNEFLQLDDESKIELGTEGFKLVKENYTWETIARRLNLKLCEVIYENSYNIEERQLNYCKSTQDGSLNNLILEFSNRNIYIWGAGSVGKNTKRFLSQNSVEIAGFIDKDVSKKGTLIDGVEIKTPDAVLEVKNDLNPFIIIASSYYREIVEELKNMGFIKRSDYLIQDTSIPYLFLK